MWEVWVFSEQLQTDGSWQIVPGLFPRDLPLELEREKLKNPIRRCHGWMISGTQVSRMSPQPLRSRPFPPSFPGCFRNPELHPRSELTATRPSLVSASRTLLISGASRGIGRSIAERLLAEGHRLSLGVRHPEAMAGNPLGEAARRHPDRVLLHPYDARDPQQATAWVEATLEHFGGISGLIHCAGVFSRAGLLFAPGQQREIEDLWQVNLMGPWWLTRAAWPALVASGDGRVITWSR